MSSIPAARATPIIPFAERLYRPLEPYAYTLIRVATGAIFVPHGVLKLFFGGANSAMGYGLGVLELAGVLKIIVANIGKGWLWTRGGVQYHTSLLGMLIAVAIGGAGRYAIQKSIEARLPPIGYALARVWFALLILPSGYEKVFADGAARSRSAWARAWWRS